MSDTTLINVEIGGRGGFDVRLSGGSIAAVGSGLDRVGTVIDSRGGALLPGLHDHHLHIFALAAREQALSLEGVDDIAAAIADADRKLPHGAWLRVLDYDDAGDLLDAAALDRIVIDRPVRVQHRTGSLWILNGAALARLSSVALPAGAGRDAVGRPTGQFWREDRWLRDQLPSDPPSLAGVAEMTERYGITGLTDASVTNDDAAARALLSAARAAKLRARLTMMGSEGMTPPVGGGYRIGPVKILLDDHQLGELDDHVATIVRAHGQGRAVAIHCVTPLQISFALAAWKIAGVEAGDRIEHGSMIDDDAAREIALLGLTVVTQSGFIFGRGDRYLRHVDPAEQALLYRFAGLRRMGIGVAGSSDAPYGPLDPWIAMRAAVDRRTRGGTVLGREEAVSPMEALRLYLGSAHDPAGPSRRIEVGAPTDLCLMRAPIADVLDVLSSEMVAATIVDGEIRLV